MYPTVEDVIRIRMIARALLRLAGVITALFCFAPLSSWLIEGLQDGDLFYLRYYASRLTAGAIAILLGAVMFFGARSIARLLVPMHQETDCPACRYPMVGAVADRCPECGLQLPIGFAGAMDEDSVELQRRRILERAGNAPLFTVLGILLIIAGAIVSLGGVGLGFIELFVHDQGIGLLLVSVILGGAAIVGGVLLIAGADRWRRAKRRLTNDGQQASTGHGDIQPIAQKSPGT